MDTEKAGCIAADQGPVCDALGETAPLGKGAIHVKRADIARQCCKGINIRCCDGNLDRVCKPLMEVIYCESANVIGDQRNALTYFNKTRKVKPFRRM